MIRSEKIKLKNTRGEWHSEKMSGNFCAAISFSDFPFLKKSEIGVSCISVIR